jgi:hypothetical protein
LTSSGANPIATACNPVSATGASGRGVFTFRYDAEMKDNYLAHQLTARANRAF